MTRTTLFALALWLHSMSCLPEAERPYPNPAPIEPARVLEPGGVATLDPDSPVLARVLVEQATTVTVPEDRIVAPGRIEADVNRLFRVALPVPGRVATVNVRLGDRVEVGQPLLTLEGPEGDDAVAELSAAEVEENQARSVLAKARADLERLRDLYEHDAVARREVLEAKTEAALAEEGLRQAESARRRALRRLELLGLEPNLLGQRVVVSSPQRGSVIEISVAPGEFRTETAEPVMSIADLSTVWVVSEVPEAQIRFVRTGDGAEIEVSAYPGERFRGRVARLADLLDPETRTVRVYTRLPNPEGRLRPQMFARVLHASGTVRESALVNPDAIVRRQGRDWVLVEREVGHFEARAVEVGRRLEEGVEVLSGLESGERVVVDGALLLLNHRGAR